MIMKKWISLVAAAVMLLSMSVPAGAVDQLVKKNFTLGADGWTDSFEDSWYEKLHPYQQYEVPQNTPPMKSNSASVLMNGIKVLNDPKGQNGRSLTFHFGGFTQQKVGNSQWWSNPVFSPDTTDSANHFSLASGGAAVLSFDMYLPQNFSKEGTDFTGIDLQILNRTDKLGSVWYFRQDGLSFSGGFNKTYPLPIGRWFNIKFILYTSGYDAQETINLRADLYIDGEAMEVGAAYAALNTDSFKAAKAVGFQSILWQLVTSNSGKTIAEPFDMYVDNLCVRTMQPYEVSGYRFNSGGEGSDVLQAGTTEFQTIVRNNTETAIKPAVVLAVIKDGMLESASVSRQTEVAANGEETFTVSVDIPSIDDGEYEVRAFVWDGFETMRTLINQLTLRPALAEPVDPIPVP